MYGDKRLWKTTILAYLYVKLTQNTPHVIYMVKIAYNSGNFIYICFLLSSNFVQNIKQ